MIDPPSPALYLSLPVPPRSPANEPCSTALQSAASLPTELLLLIRLSWLVLPAGRASDTRRCYQWKVAVGPLIRTSFLLYLGVLGLWGLAMTMPRPQNRIGTAHLFSSPLHLTITVQTTPLLPLPRARQQHYEYMSWSV